MCITTKTKTSTRMKCSKFHKVTSQAFSSSTHPALTQLNHRVFSFGLSVNPSGSSHLVCSPTMREENYGFLTVCKTGTNKKLESYQKALFVLYPSSISLPKF